MYLRGTENPFQLNIRFQDLKMFALRYLRAFATCKRYLAIYVAPTHSDFQRPNKKKPIGFTVHQYYYKMIVMFKSNWLSQYITTIKYQVLSQP